MVTLILTIYNKEKYLPATLASIAAQTYKDWQVIAVDDCSTDKSFSIIDNWNMWYKTIKHSLNCGVSTARNTGIKALGETDYVVFMDADDILYPDYLEKMVKKMEQDKLDMLFSLYTRRLENGDTGFLWGVETADHYDKDMLLRGNYIAPSFVMLKKSVVLDVGEFFPPVNGIEDWDYWCRVIQAGYKVDCLPEKLGEYMVIQGGNAASGMSERERKVGLVRCRQGKDYKALRSNGAGITGVKEHVEVGIPFLIGFCLMIKRPVLNTIGLLDEDFGIGSMEDVDICHRARLAGYKTVKVNGVNIQHIPETTVHHLPQGRQYWEDHYRKNQDKLAKKSNTRPRVSVDLCTYNRYDTTLPLVLKAIAAQTYKPLEVRIYDDTKDRKPMDKHPVLSQLLQLLQIKGINFYIDYGGGYGQVMGHRWNLAHAQGDVMWRLDDDNIPDPDCLEKLMSKLSPDVGAVGGVVLEPGKITTSSVASNKIEDIYLGLNQQWFIGGKTCDVDHLYSTFIYRKCEDFYPTNLSRIGHREETIMSYRMRRAGWRLVFNPEAVTWHMRQPSGGIRDGQAQMFNNDEQIFATLMRDWGVMPARRKVVVLDNGLGDHYAFRDALPEILPRYPDLILACCYPDVFRDFPIKSIISIGEAQMAGYQNNIYGFMNVNNWKGNLVDAYKKYYC